MTTWSVYSATTDPVGERWLNWNGRDWKADPETTAALTAPAFSFPLTPTGPFQTGYGPGESELLAAALHVIPGARTAGQVPEYPQIPRLPDGATG
ncbi:hypothetical protein IU459_11785 [Nocardia amamiensis]|uniref:DUF2510 domain-containing protein n=1 Tax=Nocardia amamiensis TaxID=404578 RepID=A0ABS0CNV4_9NOCA|nr:hypothetical protein [Nocardia amamiensis]MBF6298221.1 hypothetical protein [Nocardia amamiensis]